MKKKIIITAIILIIVISSIVTYFIITNKKQDDPQPITNDNEYEIVTENNSFFITSIDEYENKKEIISEYIISEPQSEEEILKALNEGNKIFYYPYKIDDCNKSIKWVQEKIENNTLKLYGDISEYCGVCAPITKAYVKILDSNIQKVEIYDRIVSERFCSPVVAYKPIIYIYPTEDTDMTITLGNPTSLTHTYPIYKNNWNIHVTKDGNIYDYNTRRNYYALYWEGIDNSEINTNEGFVISGNNTVSFLEEKLALLGLNEREINEFIIYWIDKLESNPYNYIRFRTTEEVNEYMPLNCSKNIDTLIRIIMDYAPLSEKIDVKEQKLTPTKRQGFTIVEWGGRKIK